MYTTHGKVYRLIDERKHPAHLTSFLMRKRAIIMPTDRKLSEISYSFKKCKSL